MDVIAKAQAAADAQYDPKTGMLIGRFGVDFNPLKLDEHERIALLTAGLSMMSAAKKWKL
jgi:hypothetical protein